VTEVAIFGAQIVKEHFEAASYNSQVCATVFSEIFSILGLYLGTDTF